MATAARRGHPSRQGRASTWMVVLPLAVVCGLGLMTVAPSPAAAHGVPTSAVQLDERGGVVEAVVSVPVSDLEAGSGLELKDQHSAYADDDAAAIKTYLLAHFVPTSDDGQPWTVQPGDVSIVTAGDPATTGHYQQLRATLTLTPPAGTDVQSFNLGYDAVVHKVADHVVIVTVNAGWAGEEAEFSYQAGVVRRDTTNTIQPLHVELASVSNVRGFLSMVALGMEHIQHGTDHQLFLLTLLLPAPLLVVERRWSDPVPASQAVRRIAMITASFTLGHSLTLALGALGLSVPQGPVEALIAVSILAAAAHATRPLFPGREALVAASFGLIHGLALAQTLRELDLSGGQLVLSLLGFNLGIEAMQLIVVALVLPPLIELTRSNRYQILRTTASMATAVAAVGWLVARLGMANPIAQVADHLGVIAIPVVVTLWLAALVSTPASSAPPPEHATASIFSGAR